MDRWLGLARSWYVLVGVVGLAVAVGGIGGWVGDTPAAAASIVGVLSLSAAAWVRSGSVPKGMLASIGIPVGGLAVGNVAYLWASVVATFGVLPATLAIFVAIVPSAVAVSAAVIMWRCSTRPWDDASPGASHPPGSRA